MSDAPNGLEVLSDMVERRSRAVRPPRRPKDVETNEANHEGATTDDESERARARPAPVGDAGPPPARPRKGTASRRVEVVARPREPAGEEDRPAVGAGEPVANLAVRVRRSLDEHLDELVHLLKRDGVRSSKVEMVEMLLWELPSEPTPELRDRLGAFRRAAPREESL